jgi:hypothetical protein
MKAVLREPRVSQAGPFAIASFEERVLTHSLSSESQAALEQTPPAPKPATPEGEARMVVGPAGTLTLVRAEHDIRLPSPREAMKSPVFTLAAWMLGKRGRDQGQG